MVAWAVKDFGGEVPRRDPRLLPDNMAERSTNCDLSSGHLEGFSQPEFIINLAGKAAYPVRKAYRFPGVNGGPDVWLPLPSEFSSVAVSPLANDTLHRVYWTNPQGQPAAGAWWTTYADLVAGNPAFNMGYIPVSTSIVLSVTTSGGTPAPPPLVDRSYCFTYIDQFGNESSPSLPSADVAGPADAIWHITGLPTTPPPTTPGLNLPIPVKMRLYRTLAGATSNALFYFVADLNFPYPTGTYLDTIPDGVIVNNNTLQSAAWNPPLPNMDGLISMPGGMLVAFTGNTIHFCVQDHPHAWPASYDQSLMFPIVGMAIWQQALVVLTQGYPSTGSGSSPDQFTFSQVQVPEPCISRGSIVTDLAGVYYASQNGLIMLNYFGMQNQTLSNMTRKIWLTEYHAASLIACRHRASYLAINGTGMGFVIDYSEARMGITHVSPFVNVVSVWNDVFSGDAYMCADQVVYRWDSVTTPPLTYRWRSKQFYLPAPSSLGACHISSELDVDDQESRPVIPPPHDNMEMLVLPPGVYAIFKLFAGPEGANLVHTQVINQPRQVFRLPSGFKAFCWQFELIACKRINSVELASTMRELKKV